MTLFGQVRSRTVGYRRLPARTAVVNRIAGIILGVISITVQANPFQVFDGDGSFFTNKIGPGQEILLVKALQISNGPYSITNTPSGIFSVSKVFLSSEGLRPGSTIRLYFCPEETDSICTIRSWHGGDLYTEAEDDDFSGRLFENLRDVNLDHSTLHPGDELLVFCYNHLDDIDRENLIGSLVRPHIQEITSRSFSCFYRNAFLLGDVDLGKLEQECWRRRIKVIATKLLYLTLFYSPLAFWACLRLRRMKTHRTACVVIYCVVWIAICTMTLFSSINSSDIGANLLLTVGCVAHAIYLCAALCRMMKRSM